MFSIRIQIQSPLIKDQYSFVQYYTIFLFYLKNSMPYDNDDQYSLVRTIRYNKKDNDNPFLIKYYGNMPLKFIVEDKKTSNNAQPSKEKIQEKIQTPKAQKVAKQAKQSHYERKNQKYRQTQIKQIEELKKFAKVDIKKLKKQQRKEAQRQKKEQERQASKKEKQERLKSKKESKNQQITQAKEQKIQKKVEKKIQSVVSLNRIRSKSISQIQKHDFKKKDRCQFLTRPEPQKASSRRIYDQYLQIEEIEESRRKGERKYYRGVVEFSDRIKWFGKIKTLQVDGTLVVQGKSRNRCIHEDQIYFEILEETQLKTYCKVVAIIPPDVKRQIVGRIDFLQEKRLYYITPINKRFIAMNVRMNEIQRSWLKQINEKYFIVEFYNWERNSQYPECTVIAEYGRFGEIEVESNALLKTHNVYEKQYTETQIESGLGKFISQADVNGEYQISPEEIANRTDLRKETIFTIDPLTARDFDDALSIRRLNEDDFDNLDFDFSKIENEEIYEIGVHIADASFFVQENSIIDQEAKKRTTSVYLVHKVLPMLPRVLCETMCSLNPGLERLTLSVWFYIDIQGNILPGVRFDRTVIKSKARFTYQQAQHIIEGKITSQTDIPEGFGCIDPKDDRVIFNDIIKMNTIAMALRKRRIQGGSLIFETPKKSFQLNEKHFPISYDIKNRCESNFLVEEYMLLANKKVGEILVDNIGSQALLRRHPFPGEKKISTFEAFMKKIGHPIKVQKSTKIQQQINKILADETIKMATKEIIKHEMIYLLETADYFVVGDTEEHQWLHYALNMPVYTHFTSPIRRYPDIIVHRQLISVIQANKKNTKAIPFNDDILKSLVERCNKNKTNAKKVSSDCEKLFLCLYLKDKPAFTQAILVGVEDWGFKISVPKYDCRVVLKLTDMKNIKVLKFEKTQDDRKYMHVQVSEQQVSMKLVLKELQQIHIRLGSTETFPLDYRINLVFPHPKKAGQKIIIK